MRPAGCTPEFLGLVGQVAQGSQMNHLFLGVFSGCRDEVERAVIKEAQQGPREVNKRAPTSSKI